MLTCTEVFVLYCVMASEAACESAVMMAGPGKMWQLTMPAQVTIVRGPPTYCSLTVSTRRYFGQPGLQKRASPALERKSTKKFHIL